MEVGRRILNAVFSSLEDVEGGMALKMVLCNIPVFIESLIPAITQHEIRPFLPPHPVCVGTRFPSMFSQRSLHPLSFFPLAITPPSFSFPIHIKKKYLQHSKTCSIRQEQATHSLEEGG